MYECSVCSRLISFDGLFSAKMRVCANTAYHVPRDAVPKQRVGRSKSSSAQAAKVPAATPTARLTTTPMTTPTGGSTEPSQGGKQPLRKYNSFPYQVFLNDLGYSSEESLPSPDQMKRAS